MDHVPPKTLFEPHDKSNLVTVPCCFRCNNSASMDDQYFLVFIGLREDATQEPEHHKLWQKAHRTLKKKEASKFRQKVTSKIKFVQPVTPMGINSPPALSVPVASTSSAPFLCDRPEKFRAILSCFAPDPTTTLLRLTFHQTH